MSRYGNYAVVALIVVALLSVGAHEAHSRSADRYDATDCESGTLTVSTLDPKYDQDADATYENLSDDIREAFDRARTGGGTARIDPDILAESRLLVRFEGVTVTNPIIVVADGTRYNVIPETSNCPTVAGLPPVSNVVVDPLVAIYRVFSPLYLPAAAVLAVVLGYRTVVGRLRFE